MVRPGLLSEVRMAAKYLGDSHMDRRILSAILDKIIEERG